METKLRVELLSHTEYPLELIYSSARQCYSSDDAADIFATSKYMPDEQMEKLVRKVLVSGHTSVCECVSFSFAISGVSRALSHQLVRHRIASYSQQSQRYVKADDFDYLIPPAIAAIPEAVEVYRRHMDRSNMAYGVISDMLALRGIGDKAAEDARFVLPNACATKLVVTMNCRALLHFFEERCCNRAQWENRALAKAMLEICKDKLPVVFANAGPKCKRLGRCPEAKPCRQHKEE